MGKRDKVRFLSADRELHSIAIEKEICSACPMEMKPKS
jgi:hypothetical protein